METTIEYWEYIGIMEEKLETTIGRFIFVFSLRWLTTCLLDRLVASLLCV